MSIKHWTIVSCLSGICAGAIFLFYPSYEGNEFPLFTDIITFFLFLPSYFMLFCAIIPLVIALLIHNKVAKISVIFVIGVVAIVNSFQYIVIGLVSLKLLVIFFTLLPTFIFWMVVLAIKANHIAHSTS